jgi:hypothetical protein
MTLVEDGNGNPLNMAKKKAARHLCQTVLWLYSADISRFYNSETMQSSTLPI